MCVYLSLYLSLSLSLYVCIYIYMYTTYVCVYIYIYVYMYMSKSAISLDSLRGSSVKLGTRQKILAWPPRKDGTHKHTPRVVNMF